MRRAGSVRRWVTTLFLTMMLGPGAARAQQPGRGQRMSMVLAHPPRPAGVAAAARMSSGSRVAWQTDSTTRR